MQTYVMLCRRLKELRLALLNMSISFSKMYCQINIKTYEVLWCYLVMMKPKHATSNCIISEISLELVLTSV